MPLPPRASCQVMFGERACNREIVPVFGVLPETCTTCAAKELSKKHKLSDEISVDAVEIVHKLIDEHKRRLADLVIAAAEKYNPFRVDGLDVQVRFRMLEQLAESVVQRRNLMRLAAAQRIAEKGPTKSRTKEPRRTKFGYRWATVSPEKAIEYKKSGFDVRYIGVAWQVKVS